MELNFTSINRRQNKTDTIVFTANELSVFKEKHNDILGRIKGDNQTVFLVYKLK